MPTVFIALQTTDETRPIIEAILADNPHAVLNEQPAMVKIDAQDTLVVKRQSIEERIGRDFDLQELNVHTITLAGNIEETDESVTLSWNT
ncbi:MmoB/DmpM family protein [Castellaniella defragrans]|jgi:phenol hydroxylase P2 protein|uniref:Phenol hydroxylase, P2 regulatory component DmpM n=1 Tax=Castellaniella defragrans (strain DSM 12143 / CCUG 39792 / 65Phen) TaxID=1437824 RepID=W8WUW4_CASD6|nr:MmoB/DmpM family protein [Castellaniella defragrans]CDM23344.1 Phenol hydroxylase, P2 regulatory component DmpM [Castellaniella defragrans 65Phen]